ncbi:hypothetical protein C8A03DRAFT_39603 [Achaetomium macrosporum]|uniref:Uncharacterized protein n=1 Tax=Achaetomium macrosporum TaxID=79813 RepID=A0AAN7C0F4_9PEZI|nr:hypothetical protein C8A03DRAFT_39603 [Achaetomium macrosporum]
MSGTNGHAATQANWRTETSAVDISVALGPNNLNRVLGLVRNINSIAEKASAGDENARLELVEKARSLDNGSTKNANELAAKLGIDTPLLCRLMRYTAAMRYIIETGPDEYKPTNFSSSLSIPVIGDGYTCISGGLMDASEPGARANYMLSRA